MKLLNPRIPPQSVHAVALKALVIDWAGTAVDYGSLAPVRTLQQVFAGVDLPLTEAEARRDMGLPKRDHIQRILALPRVCDAWTALRGRTPDEADIDELYQVFIPLQSSCLLQYSAVIPGVVEAVERFRRRGLKIGTTTGYTRELLDMLVRHSSKAGYIPDCNLSPGDVGAGRPSPFMIYEISVRLQVYPLAAIAKIGDTPSDIQEGLNAGVWSIGVAATGNMNGLPYDEFHALPVSEQEARLAAARAELAKAGAHYVVDSLADVDSVLGDIDARLRSAAESG
ncbi:MAG TPA: phosphonoacetaldehyde hydrolase [Candidatus Acidoferrum sp.]